MDRIPLYQTVRGGEQVVIKEPIYCQSEEARLGYGYYFWEYDIDNAHWWGRSHYKGNYEIYQSYYDRHSEKCFDLLGNPKHRKYTLNAYQALMNRKNDEYTIAEVLEILKKEDSNFHFWAIRAQPIQRKYADKKLDISFAKGNCVFINTGNRIQICVLDLRFLLDDQYYKLIYPEDNTENYVI